MPKRARETPWLERRDDDGKFYAFWYDRNSRRTERFSLRTEDPDEARLRFAAFLKDGKALFEKLSASPSVNTVLDHYRRHHLQPNAVALDRAETMIHHLLAFFSGTPICEIDVPRSHQYAHARRTGKIAGKRGYPAQDATIRRELSLLVSAANHAVKWKVITAAQKPQVDLPRNADPRPVWLTHEELDRLRDGARLNPDLRAFIDIAYFTGARRESIERLKVSQVDLVNGQINLAWPTDRTTKKRRPVVPLFPELRPTVEALMLTTDNEWLFRREGRTFYMTFHRLAVRLGLEGKSHPHVLRHTRATHLLMAGKSPYAVAKLLGDTVQTVERYYGKYDTAGLQELLS